MHAIAEKEHPKGPLGTVKGHKTTKKQQALFGIARGMQKGETSKGYSKAGAKIAGGLSGKEVHKIASKPKSDYRKSPKNSESALARVMQMVTEVEAQNPNPDLEEHLRYGDGNLPPEEDLPSHAASDEGKFSEIEQRLNDLESMIMNVMQKTGMFKKPGGPT